MGVEMMFKRRFNAFLLTLHRAEPGEIEGISHEKYKSFSITSGISRG